jgi:hypothetical protein
MAHIRQVEPDDATGPLKAVYDAASTRAGGVAHIIKVMGLDPQVLGISIQFYVGLMKSDNALSKARKENAGGGGQQHQRLLYQSHR